MFLLGKCSSLIDKKTACVFVERSYTHRLYKKIIKVKKKYLCHIPTDIIITQFSVVKIKQSKPFSKRKKFVISELVI